MCEASVRLHNTVLCSVTSRIYIYTGRNANYLHHCSQQCSQWVIKYINNVHKATLLLEIYCKRILNKVSIIAFPLLWLPSQLVANAILFVCVNCVGIFHLWMTEHDLRISNQKREEFSAIRSQKEIKKYQQVKQQLQQYSFHLNSKLFLCINSFSCCHFTHSRKNLSSAWTWLIFIRRSYKICNVGKPRSSLIKTCAY